MILLAVFTCLILYGIYELISKLINLKNLKNETAAIKTYENDYENDFKNYQKKILIGNDGNREIFLPIDTSHVFVCGTTGSGKTVALSNFINASVKNNLPMLIIDGKGDIGNNSLREITKKLKGNGKVYIIDLNNPENSDKYNPFKNTSPTVIKDMLINLTDWSEEHYKLNAERYLQRLIHLMFLADIPLSFQNIVNHIPVKSFLDISASLVKNEVIGKEDHLVNTNIADESGKVTQGSAARFSTLIESELGSIFDISGKNNDENNGIDIYTALKEGASILFILNPLTYPELSPLIGNLIIIDSKKAISNIYNNNLGRIFFIMDEINVYASKSLLDLINKSRSADITCILATQSLSDLDASTSAGEYFKEQIIENCNNYIVLRQNSATNAEQWANIIGTRSTVEVTYQLQARDGSNGTGSARIVREYLFHPDEIKNLARGKAVLVSKVDGNKSDIHIHKPF